MAAIWQRMVKTFVSLLKSESRFGVDLSSHLRRRLVKQTVSIAVMARSRSIKMDPSSLRLAGGCDWLSGGLLILVWR